MKSSIIKAECNYHQKQFQEAFSDIRLTWKAINSILNKNNGHYADLSVKIGDTLCKDSSKIVNTFNEYFVNIGPSLASTIPATSNIVTDFLSSTQVNSIAMFPTTKVEIGNIIKALKNKSSPGLDDIPNSVLKFASSFISLPLSTLINSSFNTGKFPNKLKEAKVIPIYKAGDRTKIENYRPISILNSISKIYEKAISTRLVDYLKTQNFFHTDQYGFRPNHSTSSALITFNEFICSSIDNNEIPISIFIDLSKAFDTLDHVILLTKLQHFGIRGIAWALMQDYLSNRTQRVFCNNTLSDSLSVSCGVPQGSILGPLLFLIYINDIYKSSALLKFIMFADDTTLLFTSKSISNLNTIINTELNKVCDWLKTNKLSINVSKTNYIVFKKNLPLDSIKIHINNLCINQVLSTKFLGVIITSDMTWKEHIRTVTTNISRTIGVITRIRYKISYKTALLLYDTLILSQLNYCNLIWASTYKTSLLKLYSLQKRALKICYGKTQKTNPQSTSTCSQSIYTKTNRLSIYDLNQIQIAKFIFQTIHKINPPTFNNMFSFVSNVHSHNTRADNRHDLFMQHAKTNTKKFSTSVRGPSIWNSIPISIRQLSTLTKFITSLKRYYLSGESMV